MAQIDFHSKPGEAVLAAVAGVCGAGVCGSASRPSGRVPCHCGWRSSVRHRAVSRRRWRRCAGCCAPSTAD